MYNDDVGGIHSISPLRTEDEIMELLNNTYINAVRLWYTRAWELIVRFVNLMLLPHNNYRL